MITVIVFSKSILKTSTFWLNFAFILLLICEAAITANLPFIGSEYFTFLILVLNIINRFRTKMPATFREGKPVIIEDDFERK